MSTTIELGRHGTISSNGSIKLEVQRFAGNRPTVHRIIGVSPDSELRSQRIYPNSSGRTGGGNGNDRFEGLEDGIYWIDDILGTSSSRSSTFVVLEDDDVTEYTRSKLNDVLAVRYAGDVALAAETQRLKRERLAIAQVVITEISEERQLMIEPVTDGDLTAHPEFSNLPSAAGVVEKMSHEDFDRLDFVMRHAAPFQFVVHSPVFAKASTPEKVFAQARINIETRKAQLDAAKAQADTAGWPALKGSPKQITWAETIRAKVAAKDPKAKALKTAITAKYWIDNHR
jgi:hypothetical protein